MSLQAILREQFSCSPEAPATCACTLQCDSRVAKDSLYRYGQLRAFHKFKCDHLFNSKMQA